MTGAGAAAKVLDRIRLLLLTDLTMFSNLKGKILVPMSEHESVLVDIDKVMKTLGSEVRRVGDHHVREAGMIDVAMLIPCAVQPSPAQRAGRGSARPKR